MTVELKIKLEGTTSGLAEHRLSIAEFGEALNILLSAVRRTGTSIETDATSEVGAQGGRYSKTAQHLDLQLVEVQEGSVNANFIISCEMPPGETLYLFNDLDQRTAIRLVEDIESEAEGTPSNALVRKFLSSLPAGLNTQKYEAWADGELLRETKVGVIKHLDEASADNGPSFQRFECIINKVSFDEDGVGVALDLKGASKTLRDIKATPEQINRALSWRGKPLIAQVLISSDDTRLITLWLAEQPPSEVSKEQRVDSIFNDWSETLKQLAQ